MTIPAKVQLFGLAICVDLAGIEDTTIAHLRPVALRHGEERLEASIAAGCADGGSGETAERNAELLQLLSGADAVVIKEQQAIGDGAGDDTNGFGTPCLHFDGSLLLGERVRLPVLLVRAFIAVDRNKSPGDRKILELI